MGFYTFFREVEYRSGFNSTFRYSESPFHYPQAFVLCHYFLRCRFRIGHIPFHAVPFFVFLYLVFVYTDSHIILNLKKLTISTLILSFVILPEAQAFFNRSTPLMRLQAFLEARLELYVTIRRSPLSSLYS